MKKIFLFSILLAFCLIDILAQNPLSGNIKPDTGRVFQEFNMIKAPTSPGFALLGIEPSTIQTPTNPTDFSVSVLNATNDFTALPKNYALEFAPGWIWGAKNITYQDFQNGRNIVKNVLQSTVISLATTQKSITKDSSNTLLAFGFRTSLLRGDLSDEIKAINQQMNQVRENITVAASQKFRSLKKEDATYQKWDSLYKATTEQVIKDGYKQLRNEREQLLRDQADSLVRIEKKLQRQALQALATTIDFTRYGFKLDFAGGIVYEFPGQQTANQRLAKYGLWLTGGWEWQNRTNFFFVSRLLFNPKESLITADKKTNVNDNVHLDLGAKVILTSINKLTIAGEYVYRTTLNNALIPVTNKYVLLIDYQLPSNKVITFSFGKDFDGTIQRGGNLIAALNFVAGFGSSRPISD